MPNEYRSQNWKEFKAEIIELDGGACTQCKRTPSADGVVLQVHHKSYIQGKKPWEYPPGHCKTLCKGCHAVEHGRIPPPQGWEYVGDDDLGGLYGACERCGTAIRYEFYVHHEKWGTQTVGTDCCDRMTGTLEASAHVKQFDRRARFVSSTRWKVQGSGHAIKQSGLDVRIAPGADGLFRVSINGVAGIQWRRTLDEAKQLAFDVIENGKAQNYLSKPRGAAASQRRVVHPGPP